MLFPSLSLSLSLSLSVLTQELLELKENSSKLSIFTREKQTHRDEVIGREINRDRGKKCDQMLEKNKPQCF